MNDYITLTDCCGLWAGNYCSYQMYQLPSQLDVVKKKKKKASPQAFGLGLKLGICSHFR